MILSFLRETIDGDDRTPEPSNARLCNTHELLYDEGHQLSIEKTTCEAYLVLGKEHVNAGARFDAKGEVESEQPLVHTLFSLITSRNPGRLCPFDGFVSRDFGSGFTITCLSGFNWLFRKLVAVRFTPL